MISQGTRQQDRSAALFAACGAAALFPASTRACGSAAGDDPVLYLSNPPGIDADIAPRECSTAWANSTRWRHRRSAIPRSTPASPSTRWRSACRSSVPELTDLRDEPRAHARHVRRRRRRAPTAALPQLPAGPAPGRARRALRATMHRGWDQHGSLPSRSVASARTSTSRPPALVKDLKQRGLLDDTLVVWGGEFGRTVYSQGSSNGRQLRPRPSRRCFTLWMAGGGVKGRA